MGFRSGMRQYELTEKGIIVRRFFIKYTFPLAFKDSVEDKEFIGYSKITKIEKWFEYSKMGTTYILTIFYEREKSDLRFNSMDKKNMKNFAELLEQNTVKAEVKKISKFESFWRSTKPLIIIMIMLFVLCVASTGIMRLLNIR